jgi:hypothetical protein
VSGTERVAVGLLVGALGIAGDQLLQGRPVGPNASLFVAALAAGVLRARRARLARRRRRPVR